MNSRRTAKAAQAIKQAVSSTVLFDLKDPRVKNVTVTDVEVSADMKHAKVYVSIMGDEKTQALSMHGLRSSRGFLQAKLSDFLQMRYTPILTFVIDPGIKKSIEASRLIREALNEDGMVDDSSEDLDDDLSAADFGWEEPEDDDDNGDGQEHAVDDK